MSEIHGHCAPQFARVRDAFARNFSDHGEIGAAVAVYADGRPVVDLWGGLADPRSGRRWNEDTTALAFSTTKGVTATCIHLLVERGVLSLDEPVATYWPEFAAAGKQDVSLACVLAHRAGLPEVEAELTLAEIFAGERVCQSIAAQTPIWEPQSTHGYHVRTFGWILGEVVHRATGKTIGRFLADEIADPLGLELQIGVRNGNAARIATIIPPEPPTDAAERALRDKYLGPDTLLGRVLSGPSGLLAYGPVWNSPELRAAEIPSSNGIATARSLARLYAALIGEVDGHRRLLAAETVARACEEASSGEDHIIVLPTRFGLGYMLAPFLSPACTPSCFGHAGAGGSLAFADLDRGIGFGYLMNRMDLGLSGDPRAAGLVEAVYTSL